LFYINYILYGQEQRAYPPSDIKIFSAFALSPAPTKAYERANSTWREKTTKPQYLVLGCKIMSFCSVGQVYLLSIFEHLIALFCRAISHPQDWRIVIKMQASFTKYKKNFVYFI